jgi:CPA2 family monovalent cation:H+ antiporter-2
LFLLSVIVLCLGAALGTQIFGLSAVFGAFLVGIVLRETKFVHQALAEVTPLRDIFAALFFVSLGMLLDPIFVYHNWTMVLLTVVIIFVIKFFVVSGVVRAFGYSLSIAAFAGLGLFQIGEFSFIIAQSGVNNNIITGDIYTLVIGSSVITMLITPLTVGLAGRAYTRLARVPLPGKSITVTGTGKPADAGDVIIAGLGRVGQNIAHALDDAGIPFTSVEIDPEVVFRAECKGAVCIYGDASNIHVLSRLDLMKANLMVVTFPDPVAVLTTVKTALSLNPKLRIIARAHRERDVAQLKALGVEELVSPEYEASLEFIRRVLMLSGKKGGEIKEAMNRVLQDKDVERFESEDEYRPWM